MHTLRGDLALFVFCRGEPAFLLSSPFPSRGCVLLFLPRLFGCDKARVTICELLEFKGDNERRAQAMKFSLS